jgi:hypothetical protein
MLQLWLVANTVLWPFSIKLGGIDLNLDTVVLAALGVFALAQGMRIAALTAKVLLAVLAWMMVSLLIAQAGPCSDHLAKSILSMPILAFLTLAGLEVGRRADQAQWLRLQRTASWLLFIAFSAFALEWLFPNLYPAKVGYRAEGRLSGLFLEPSHAAFALFPCLAILLVSEDKTKRRMGALALVGLLVFSRSSTLVALTAAWIAYRLVVQGKVRQAAFSVLAIALVVSLGAIVNYSQFLLPTVARISGIAAPGETDNISSLVYAQGWQDAWFNLRRTHGLGLGLNRMGCGALPDVPARFALSLVAGEDLNGEDGSFLFAKIVSEAGVAGIAFYIGVAIWWVRLERRLRRRAADPSRFALATQAALIFCFLSSSIIRGEGYFAGGLFLFVAAVGGVSGRQSSVSRLAALRRAQVVRLAGSLDPGDAAPGSPIDAGAI